MIKRNILTLVLLLVVGVAVAAVYTSRSAQAQGSGAHSWEYCAITYVGTRWRSSTDHKIESFAQITYFGTTGGRIEDVVGGEMGGNSNTDFVLQALSFRAIAKLGAEGWEAISDEHTSIGFNQGPVLLFKRSR